jgi:hypothetical protein
LNLDANKHRLRQAGEILPQSCSIISPPFPPLLCVSKVLLC